jgi:hypothetical protein
MVKLAERRSARPALTAQRMNGNSGATVATAVSADPVRTAVTVNAVLTISRRAMNHPFGRLPG